MHRQSKTDELGKTGMTGLKKIRELRATSLVAVGVQTATNSCPVFFVGGALLKKTAGTHVNSKREWSLFDEMDDLSR